MSEQLKVLDGMPFLRAGAGGSPQNGGCLIEVAGYLWDGSWTDLHDCVHPVLRKVGIRVNDSVDDVQRQRLLVEVIPRIVGTSIADEVEDKRVCVGLALYSARKVAHLNPDPRVQAAIDAAQGWLDGTVSAAAANAAYAAANAANAAAANAANAAYAANAATAATATAATYATAAATASVDEYVGLIDEYDRLAGRVSTDAVVEPEAWARVCEVLVGGGAA